MKHDIVREAFTKVSDVGKPTLVEPFGQKAVLAPCGAMIGMSPATSSVSPP
jgi:hypothetical protein